MPEAGPYAGNDGAVYVGANIVAKVRNFEYDVTQETREQTSLGDAWRQRKAGLKDVAGRLTCWLDKDDTNGQEAISAGAEVTLSLNHGSNSDSPSVDIIALITSRRVVNGEGNDTVELEVGFEGGVGATIVTETLVGT